MKLNFGKSAAQKDTSDGLQLKPFSFFFRGAVSAWKIVPEQRNLFGLKIEFLY